MTIVESTIEKGGSGDYTSVGAWETATNLNGGADIWKGVINDSNGYDEFLSFDVEGTSSSYVWLTVADAHKHSGVWDTSKARMDYTGGATAVIELNADYVFIENMQIYRPSTGGIGTSDEGIRVASGAGSGCLISRSIIWTNEGSGSDQTDGIYTGNWTINSLFIDHCIVYGWSRAGLHAQTFNGNHNQTIYVDHCVIVQNATNILTRNTNATYTNTFHIYNTIALENLSGATTSDDIAQGGGNTTEHIFNGSNNLLGSVSATVTNNMTDNQIVSGGILSTNTSDSYIVADDSVSAAATDFTPTDHFYNSALEDGIYRVGSEPDPRQDFSIDIAGNTRPANNIDIGAFQVSALAFLDDFESGTISNDIETDAEWEKISSGSTQVGNIRYQAGNGGQVANADDNDYGYGGGNNQFLVYGVVGTFPDDQYAEAQYVGTNGAGVGISVRGQDSVASTDDAEGYYVQYGGGVVRIRRMDGGNSGVTISESFPTTVDGAVIRITAIGSTLTVYADGVQLIQTTDTTYTSGRPGLVYWQGTDGGSGANVDNFKSSGALGAAPAPTVNLGIATDTSTAQTITPEAGNTNVNIGQASDTTSALAITPTVQTPGQTVVLGIADSSSTALPLTTLAGNVSVDLGLAVTVDTANAYVAVVGNVDILLGIVTDSLIPLSVTPEVGAATVALGLAESTETPLPISATVGNALVGVGQVETSTTAQAFTPEVGSVVVSLSTPETALSASSMAAEVGNATIDLGIATDSLEALSITIETAGQVGIGIASDSMEALSITPVPESVSVDLGIATTGIIAFDIFPFAEPHSIDIGIAEDTLTANAFSITTDGGVVLGIASDSLSPVLISPVPGNVIVNFGQAEDTLTANAFTVDNGISVDFGQVTLIDSALPVLAEPGSVIVNIGIATTGTTALGMTADDGTVEEIDHEDLAALMLRYKNEIIGVVVATS